VRCLVCKKVIPAEDDWHGFEVGFYCTALSDEDYEVSRGFDPLYMCSACYEKNKERIMPVVLAAVKAN